MKTDSFWKWFSDNNDMLVMLDDLSIEDRENLLQEFDKSLKKYNPGLTFDIGPKTANGRNIIFSAEGDMEFFEDLINLVDNAPILDWWEFIPFKQPHGEEVKVLYENLSFNSKEMYFLPLESEDNDEVIGLRVAVKNYEEDNEDILVGVYITLEAQIGEFDCSTLIGYLEVCPISGNLEEEGFIPLTKFPEFVEWFKNKHELN